MTITYCVLALIKMLCLKLWRLSSSIKSMLQRVTSLSLQVHVCYVLWSHGLKMTFYMLFDPSVMKRRVD